MTDVSSTDTIAAVSTPPGRGAIALVRVSGSSARSIAVALGLGELPARRVSLRRVRHPTTGEGLDRALITWFPAPASYTGEDMLELSSHGGSIVPATLLDAACAAGARPAEPGEFTRRAYLNGKLDLLQVEATLDLIDARSPRLRQAALFSLERGLSQRIEGLRARLLELQALIAYDIDFPDEDDGPVDRVRIRRVAEDLDSELGAMLRLAPEGELLREGALTVIAGRPNTGKSSLFNALLGVERTIVTDIPGTTRDAIEALVSVDGYPFRIVDTAGIRESVETIEGLGIEVARSYLDRADLVLFCIDPKQEQSMKDATSAAAALTSHIRPERLIVIYTKSDIDSGFVRAPDDVGFNLSVRTGEGLELLRARMLGVVFSGLQEAEEVPLVTRGRHSRALGQAKKSLKQFRETWEKGYPPEIASAHLQDAVLPLEDMLGAITNEDVLDALFSNFCVGK
ncbi:MAG: tRNA uridine-5-carboxymethylaminomethyl(34) synthesis GTPase MnmE [Gemmatimonadales bacterium]|nr:MAG: tRNA uridine-5-carboxymethylaminomethyl(34) synthesis GTPase MnmE [Gemmatimonadales bacterium]